MSPRLPLMEVALPAGQLEQARAGLERILHGRAEIVPGRRREGAAARVVDLAALREEPDPALVAIGDPGLLELARLLRDRPALSHVVSPAIIEEEGWEDALAAVLWTRLVEPGAPLAQLYLGRGFRGRRAVVRDSDQVASRVESILERVREAGGSPACVEAVRQITEELVTNGLFAALAERQGRPVPRTERLVVGDDEGCEVTYGVARGRFFVRVRDPRGALGRARVLEVLGRCAQDGPVAMDDSRGGAGLGFWRVFQLAETLLVHVHAGRFTEIVAGVPIGLARRGGRVRALHLLFEEKPATAPALTADPAPAPAARSPLQLGALVDGRYKLEELLSQGGMGRIYRACHRELDRRFALKVVSDGLQPDPEVRELFFREARLASSFDHPHIVTVTDFGWDAQAGYFLVMELLRGETLRDAITRSLPSVRGALDILDQGALALRYIHARGVVHCDLKPENIFLAQLEGDTRKRSQVKLLDFGLSWRREDPTRARLGGSPPYLAPERLSGRPPTPQSDIYSLGVLLYELLTGVWPFQGSVFDMMERQTKGPPPTPPSKVIEDAKIDPRLDELVLRAMDRDPAKRPQTAEAFHFELRAVMGMMGLRGGAGGRRGGATKPDHVWQTSATPLAIFERTGELREANQAFVQLLHGAGEPEKIGGLARVSDGAGLTRLFEQVVAQARPAHLPLAVTVEGRPRRLLLGLWPRVRNGATTSVHATVLDQGDLD